ncbi:hypothetical protein [Bacteroides acidifaciens]|uniref:hypothetical protein n=1 Tax=Bacteroides acidifaciens TaxID=85831 RepID=UPI00263ADB04|nr:hypothetical protein [Bacteroides acidifaciens]
MDKTTFDKIIKAANGRPLIAFGDNAILFNVNTEQHWLLQNATHICIIQPNPATTSVVSQQEAPFETIICDYDQIQYVRVFPDRKGMEAYLDMFTPVDLGEDVPKKTTAQIKKEVMTCPLWKASSPSGTDIGDLDVNKFGGFTPGVTMDREPDPYYKAVADAVNGKNQ